MNDLNAREFRVMDGKREIVRITIEELSFLFEEHFDILGTDYKEMMETEKQIKGLAKGVFLDNLQIYIEDMCRDEKTKRLRKIAKSLYGKLSILSEKDVLYIREQLYKVVDFMMVFRVGELIWNEEDVPEPWDDIKPTIS